MGKKNIEKKKEVKKEVIQRLVAQRNIDCKLKEGWKIVKEDATDKHGRVLGVRTNTSDLVLMEKEK